MDFARLIYPELQSDRATLFIIMSRASSSLCVSIPEDSLDRVPPEILMQVLTHVYTKNLLAARRVCKYWKAIVSELPIKCTLRPAALIADSFLHYLKCFPSTEAIDLSLTRGCEEHLSALSSLKHLREVTLPYKISAAIFEQFTDLPLRSLRSLTIDNCADPKSLVHISKLSELRQLSVRSIADWEFFLSIPPGESQNSWPSPISAGLHHIRNLPKLEKLCLKQVNALPHTFATLTTLTNVTDLFLDHTNVGSESLLLLTKLCNIQTLNLSGSLSLRDDAVEIISRFSAMKTLILNWCPLLTYSGFVHLQALTQLEKLSLCGCHVAVDSVMQLGRCLTRLKELNLKQTYLRDVGAGFGFPHLERLCLSRCLITDATILHLATNTTLRSLHLDCCRSVTASSLLHLTTLTAVERLGLSWGRSAPNIFAPTDPSSDTLTDEMLELVLKAFPCLRKLNISHRSRLTMFAMRHMCESPSLREVKMIGFSGPAVEYAQSCRTHFRVIQYPSSSSGLQDDIH